MKPLTITEESKSMIDKYEIIARRIADGDKVAFKDLKDILEGNPIESGNQALSQALRNANYREFSSKDMRTINGIVKNVYSHGVAKELLDAAVRKEKEEQTPFDIAKTYQTFAYVNSAVKKFQDPDFGLNYILRNVEQTGRKNSIPENIVNRAKEMVSEALSYPKI